jgi:AraC-like DNA-binding protein
LDEHWHAAAFRPGEGRRFVGPCGTTNLCVSIEVAGVTPASLVLQARISARQLELRERDACYPMRERPISPEAFRQAESLLRLIVGDLENRLRARWAGRFAHAAGPGARRPVQSELPWQAGSPHRLHITIALPGSGDTGGPAGHLVQAMLDYAHERYRQPMALKEIAARLDRNPNYLSGLFHLATGMGFHHYVESLRLARAEALLRDPLLRVRDAASAAGYKSANHFRTVFKSRNGLCPTAWRRSSRPAPARVAGI